MLTFFKVKNFKVKIIKTSSTPCEAKLGTVAYRSLYCQKVAKTQLLNK